MLQIHEKGHPLSFTVGDESDLMLLMTSPKLRWYRRLLIWIVALWITWKFWISRYVLYQR